MKQTILLVLLAFVATDTILIGRQKRCIRNVIGKRNYREVMEKYENKREADFLQFINENYPKYEVDITNCLIAEGPKRKLGKKSYRENLKELGPFVIENVKTIMRNKEAKKEITKAYKESDAITAIQVCKKYMLNEVACKSVVEIIGKRIKKD